MDIDDFIQLGDFPDKLIGAEDGFCLVRVIRIQVTDLDMGAKTGKFFLDFPLKASEYRNGDNHH